MNHYLLDSYASKLDRYNPCLGKARVLRRSLYSVTKKSEMVMPRSVSVASAAPRRPRTSKRAERVLDVNNVAETLWTSPESSSKTVKRASAGTTHNDKETHTESRANTRIPDMLSHNSRRCHELRNSHMQIFFHRQPSFVISVHLMQLLNGYCNPDGVSLLNVAVISVAATNSYSMDRSPL
ncbi:hypothetical protein PsorP6_000781 [Peronosclerospora sorghi]|uniref:Uncharacterized protein n=1 Tax=Peronosclerospora sorghi TaxID=230839 RepID=A0ACC0WVD4_9STRA|nr:hypothetical protein PsorP6_000781 [Peronosclerospora sorghi]